MLDASIYQAFGVKPKSVADFDNEAAQREQNQLALLMGRQKADEYTQGVAETNRLRQVLGGGADLATPEGQRLALAAAPLKASALIKDRTGMAKDAAHAQLFTAQASKATQDTQIAAHEMHLRGVVGLQSPEDVQRWADSGLKAGVFTPEQYQRTLQTAQQITTPEALANWKAQTALGGMTVLQQMQQRVEAAKLAETARGHDLTAGTALATNAATVAASRENNAATVGVQRDRLALEQNAPRGVVHETDAGTMLIDPRTGAATPVTSADGAALRKPAPALKAIPVAANTAIISNAQNLSKAKQALELLQGGKVGALEGDPAAVGWKGYAPPAVLNRMDPKGIDTRAMIADLGSMVLHDRSGAAITASEFPRLAPFIPAATDSPETARKKLARFVQVYEQEQQALADTYSADQGYKPNPLAPGGSPRAAPAAVALARVASEADYHALPSGAEYTDPSGTRRRKK